jgi:hypothetical protein
MCYFSIKSGVGWEGKKWFQGLRRLLCSQPKAITKILTKVPLSSNDYRIPFLSGIEVVAFRRIWAGVVVLSVIVTVFVIIFIDFLALGNVLFGAVVTGKENYREVVLFGTADLERGIELKLAQSLLLKQGTLRQKN